MQHKSECSVIGDSIWVMGKVGRGNDLYQRREVYAVGDVVVEWGREGNETEGRKEGEGDTRRVTLINIRAEFCQVPTTVSQ